MFMHKDDVAIYPRCAALLQRTAGAIKGTKVFDAFIEACTMQEQDDPKKARKIAVELALRWAAGPMVEPVAGLLAAPELGRIQTACGFTPTFAGRADRVLVTDYWFKGYEFGLTQDQADAARRLMATTLHELVHWVRNRAGASDDVFVGSLIPGRDGQAGHYEEAGRYFVTKAYGVPSYCTDGELLDAQMTTVMP